MTKLINDICELNFIDISKIDYFEIETNGDFFYNSWVEEEDYNTKEKFEEVFGKGSVGSVSVLAHVGDNSFLIHRIAVTFDNYATAMDDARDYIRDLVEVREA